MDNGEGKFETPPPLGEFLQRNPDLWEAYEKGQHVFQVGQEVELKGSRFKIKALGKKFMRLELLRKP